MGLLCSSFTNKVAGFQSIDKFTENKMLEKDIFQQTFVGLQDVFKTCLEDVLRFVNKAISDFSGYLEDILENEKLL